MFLGFSIHAWITIATVLTMFSVLLFTKLRADLVFLGAIAILFLTGVLSIIAMRRLLMNLIILAANIFIVNVVYPLTPLN